MNVPDGITPIVGWRVWEPQENLLHSPLMGIAWQPHTTLEAQYLALTSILHEQHVPCENKGCHCGIHAKRQSITVWRSVGIFWEHDREDYVLGVVALWGRVVVGTTGYRAQYARIAGLCDAEMADVYNVPFFQKGAATEIQPEELWRSIM